MLRRYTVFKHRSVNELFSKVFRSSSQSLQVCALHVGQWLFSMYSPRYYVLVTERPVVARYVILTFASVIK